MFDVLTPGKLILTLQSRPPFVVESALALALTVLLAAPLIARVFLLLDEPLMKSLTKRTVTPSRIRRHHERRVSASLVMRYPGPGILGAASSSSLHPARTREVKSSSASTLPDGDGAPRDSSGRKIERRTDERRPKRRRYPSLDPPSPSADAECRLIDISNLDYKAYRHKLIEDTLRKQYDDSQPPGDVVLNSLHLNSADSVIGVRLNDRYDHSLFDFVEEYYDARKATSGGHVARPHPLDHFLIRGARRPKTAERETETTLDDLASLDRDPGRNGPSLSAEGNLPKSPSTDDNANPCAQPPPRSSASFHEDARVSRNDQNSKLGAPSRRVIPTQSRKRADKARPKNKDGEEEDRAPSADNFDVRRESSARKATNRPASAGSASAIPRTPALSRAATLPERRKVMKSPGAKTSAGCLRGSAKKLGDYADELPPGERTERETANFISPSSSEIVSICSDSSKQYRDEMSCRSRESSVSSKNRARPPWLSANRGVSFNRKYGNITKNSARAGRPMSACGGSLPQKLAVSRGARARKHPSASLSHNPTWLEPKAASFAVSREKGFIKMSVEKREEDVTIFSRQQRDKLEDVGNTAAAENNEEESHSKMPESPSKEAICANDTVISKRIPGDAESSFLSPEARTQVGERWRRRRRRRSPRVSSADAPAPAAASVAVSSTWTTKEPRLTARSDGGARKKSLAGSTRRLKSPLVRDDGRTTNSAKLNCGRRQSATNPARLKGAPLSPKIELSAQVLNSADDTDKREEEVIGGKLAGRTTSRITLRESAESTAASTIASPVAGRNAEEATSESVALKGLKVPKIIQRLRTGPAGAGQRRPENHRSSLSCPTAQRNANPGAKSGSSGAKLNARSNDAADKMKCHESSKGSSVLRENSVADEESAHEKRIAGIGPDEETLKLPRHDSKIGLAMNSALRRYIKTLKRGLLDHTSEDGVALASLSLTDAISILSEQKNPLSLGEIRELQSVLERVERNPELLRKEPLPSAQSVA